MTPLDPLLLFVVANTVGPSTSSLYSLYLGATYGVRGALGYTLGTSLGFSIVVTTSSVLVAVAYEIPAGGQFGLKLFASGYTAWIASKCLRTAWTSSRDSTKALAFTKLGAYDGAIQQLANPRGWALATVSVVGCRRAFKFDHLGVRTFSWTGLCRKSKARPILDRAEIAQ